MKNGEIEGEEAENIGKCVFFSNPDILTERPKNHGAASQIRQSYNLDQQQEQFTNQGIAGICSNLVLTSGQKIPEDLLTHYSAKPYPFTFITAVKRKLALGAHFEACKRVHEEANVNQIDKNSDFIQGAQYYSQDMDYIKPLKVPDLKISPKSMEFSQKEGCTLKDITPAKLENVKDGTMKQKGEKVSAKSTDRVQRKLDFSLSDGQSIISSENIEPLKTPELSIASNLSKKKEYARDSFREKENRSKRIRKDDGILTKAAEIGQSMLKRSKDTRTHVSRKELDDFAVKKFKGEHALVGASKEDTFVSKKSRCKNFATSTVKKCDEKRHRPSGTHIVKTSRDKSLESKCRSYSSESVSDRGLKVQERVLIKDSPRGRVNDIIDRKVKADDCNIPSSSRQIDDHKSKFGFDSKSIKQSRINSSQMKSVDGCSTEDSQKMFSEPKSFTSKDEHTCSNSVSEISEDVITANDSDISLEEESIHSQLSSRWSKTKDLEKSNQVTQSSTSALTGGINSQNFPERIASTSISTRKTSNSQTGSVTSTEVNSDSKNSAELSFSEIIADSRKISFRDDSYSHQSEFRDLVTPDINLIVRSKRRKQFLQGDDSEEIKKVTRNKTTAGKVEDGGIELLHPTALHMQFQAELHLFDSFNESLRQVMDVENSLYTAQQAQEQSLLQKERVANKEIQKQINALQGTKGTIDSEQHAERNGLTERKVDEAKNSKIDSPEEVIAGSKKHQHESVRKDKEPQVTRKLNDIVQSSWRGSDLDEKSKKITRAVEMTEVQTQTVNDIATQTEVEAIHPMPGITYRRGGSARREILPHSLYSTDQFDDSNQVDDVSLPSRLRTMSEISLHETTSSIRTETGTEISISTRDVTCSFNKYLDLEMDQLIEDERQRYDKIEMLFKSREKTLNDRTKKLVKLEEQKRALKDTGQDSRISSVKKKQRALLLKLQQEKDEMIRLKELHKAASQERKLMLQKQRNMFNPQMSTKNILTKLKRSADSQSPRRLSGPMKGYDIRSNSSMSSLVDSDRSQLEQSQSQIEVKLHRSDTSSHKVGSESVKSDFELSARQKFELSKTDRSEGSAPEGVPTPKPDKSEGGKSAESKQFSRTRKDDAKSRYEVKSQKFEEKMPRVDLLRLKPGRFEADSTKSAEGSPLDAVAHGAEFPKSRTSSLELAALNLDKVACKPDYVNTESVDPLVEESSRRSMFAQIPENYARNASLPREGRNVCAIPEGERRPESATIAEISKSKRSKLPQAPDDFVELNRGDAWKSEKHTIADPELRKKKASHLPESRTSSKRKGSKSSTSKSRSACARSCEHAISHHGKYSRTSRDEHRSRYDILEELCGLDESQGSLQALVDHSRAVKERNCALLRDIADEHRDASQTLKNGSQDAEDAPNLGEVATKSRFSTVAISRHSSGDSEKSYSRSVVVTARDHQLKSSKKLERILSAQEAALTSRRNCVEEWIAWNARLRAEENQVARMEQAAYRLANAASTALSRHDTTVSSDTSDAEGRIELLAEKLAAKRAEMARLKRDVRRQAKQRLRALETNLLNQIERYDTTIHEMRKRLDSKRVTGSSPETKSAAEFRVPEIPIQKIREIYESSDLLRSRSESDLIREFEGRRGEEYSKGSRSRRDRYQEGDSVVDYTNSATREISGKIRSVSEVAEDLVAAFSRSSSSVKDVTDLEEVKTTQLRDRVSLKSSLSEQIASELETGSDVGSSEVRYTEERLSYVIPEEEREEERTSQHSMGSGSIPEENAKPDSTRTTTGNAESVDTLKSVETVETGEIETEKPTTKTSDLGSAVLSKRLTFLELSNKNLNEDISTLENDLKMLSEMMSRLGKRSSDVEEVIQPRDSADRSTSKDISEDLPSSDRNYRIQSDSFIQEVSAEERVSSTTSGILTNREEVDKVELAISRVDGLERVDKVGETTVDEVEARPREIDFEAKSKEILNEIERSIVASEFVKLSNDEGTTCETSRRSSRRNELGSRTSFDTSSSVVPEKSGIEVATSTLPPLGPLSVDVEVEESQDEPSVKDEVFDRSCVTEISEEVEELLEVIEEVKSESERSSPFIGETLGIQDLPSEEASPKVISNVVSRAEKSVPDELPEEGRKSDSRDHEDSDAHIDEDVSNTSEAKLESEKEVETVEQSVASGSYLGLQQETLSGDKVVPLLLLDERKSVGEVADVSSTFVPRYESTSIEISGPDLEESIPESKASPGWRRGREAMQLDELDDILDIIAQESEIEKPGVLEEDLKVPQVSEEVLPLKESLDLELKREEELREEEPTETVQEKTPEPLLAEEAISQDKEEESPDVAIPPEITVEPIKPFEFSEEVEASEAIVLAEEEGPESYSDTCTIDHEAPDEKLLHLTEKKEAPEEAEREKEPEERAPTVVALPLEYEDISEESLEVSEILDGSHASRDFLRSPDRSETRVESVSVVEEIPEVPVIEEKPEATESKAIVRASPSESPSASSLSSTSSRSSPSSASSSPIEEAAPKGRSVEGAGEPVIIGPEDVSSQKQDVDASSESSEGVDTPRGVSEIEADSPRDLAEYRVDEDPLGNAESRTDFRATPPPIVAGTTEKDIEAAIDKLKASLEQPGLEVADLHAKVLRIEQLQIELKIKRLEAEEVSYYVREIPNKPPPPYTPPGGGRHRPSRASTSPPPAVVPANVDELTSFTEKATTLIYNAKQMGQEISTLEVPQELCESAKESDPMKKDRRIYNTFLFDLCKEIVVEVYRTEYEKPGPSWTKPNVKTKPMVKIPRTAEELNEYVAKEVATLFGFKTKLQRENMVMRWSRKRRDRVDELLAREAQTEEDEWTRFHHDELAVKNELTKAVLDSLIVETTRVVKAAYAKKRKIMA
ncbi:centrosome-associated protein 350 isoform X2 [Orussus abietinus]|uniref:centrosome-associated protein 350 isoform X2 n=1 Tax=Orussus abietinus TaxID=222816 RepID=UPI0006256EDC|nr:centrosome-associated protein 350 isoform X2 [Orussus abietinus]